MSEQIMTTVTATVDPAREAELIDGFQDLVSTSMPDGLIRTELLRGRAGTWTIQSLWHDREVLEAVRASGEPPAALELFRSVGADHTHDVFTVEHSHSR